MYKKEKAKENLLVIDENSKIKMIRSKLGKDSLKETLQAVPLNPRTLLICLAAGLTAGALLALFR